MCKCKANDFGSDEEHNLRRKFFRIDHRSKPPNLRPLVGELQDKLDKLFVLSLFIRLLLEQAFSLAVFQQTDIYRIQRCLTSATIATPSSKMVVSLQGGPAPV